MRFRGDTMLKKTDLKKVKDIALAFLELPIDIDKDYISICYHPFIRDTFFPLINKENESKIDLLDIRIEDNLNKVKRLYKEQIFKANNYLSFLILLNKPYLGAFFKFTKDLLSKEDYTDSLLHIWTTMEFPNVDPTVSKREWISYWKKADMSLIYSDEDKRILDKLPEEFYVYRGIIGKAKINALSWTLSQEKAEWFAKRFGSLGKVYKAKCKKKDILAYISCRDEEEIVVNWKNLENIEEV